MKIFRFKILFFLVVLAAVGVKAQTQDSIQVTPPNIGPSTVKYYLEKDLIRHNPVEYNLDTTSKDLNEEVVFKGEESPNQHLGMLGSPIRSYYFQSPKKLGVNSGMNTLSHYAYSLDDVQYYDTYSPFSSIDFVLGFNNQEYLEAKFARSVSSNAGVGFGFKRFGAKQWYGTGARNTPYSDHYSLYVNGYYMTKNKRLKLFGNYRWFRQEIFENGGVYASQNSDTLGYTPYEAVALTNLKTQSSSTGEYLKTLDKRNQWHFGATFSLIDTSNTLNLVYQFDRGRQVNYYRDNHFDELQDIINISISNKDFYSSITGVVSSDSTMIDSTVFDDLTHEIGLNGKRDVVGYYVYYKDRTWDFTRNDTIYSGKRKEEYFGGELWLDRNVKNYGAYAKYEFGSKDQTYLELQGRVFWLNVAYRKVAVLPTYLETNYVGNINSWSNSFVNKKSQELSFEAIIPVSSWMKIKPFYSRSLLRDQVYFNEKAVPVQLSESIKANALGADIRLVLGAFEVLEYIKYYNISSGQDIFRAPKWYSHTKLSYGFKVFNKKMNLRLGTDLYYRSSHQALSYMPAYQQYYVANDSYTLKDYLIVDLFALASVKTFDFYAKFNHVNQLAGEGYFVTPDYPGMSRAFELGINWKFYK